MRYFTNVASILAVAICKSSCTAQRPEGTHCNDLPSGYCHRRTARDFEHVKQWNENAGQGNNSGKDKGNDKHGNLRRNLPQVTAPPTYVPFSPAEYEEVEGILLAYDQYGDFNVVTEIAKAVTVQGGTKVYMVANSSQQAVAESVFQNAGVDMNLVEWVLEDINSVWIRDYGPRFICVNDVRAAVDTAYYSSRPLDDNLPVELGKEEHEAIGFGHDNYDLNSEVMHSGGNAGYFSTNVAFASGILLDDNIYLDDDPDIVEEMLKAYWVNYHGVELHIFHALSYKVDGTGHIDMWFMPVDDSTVIIGEWEEEDKYGSKAITDGAAQYMKDQGYNVYRTRNWTSDKRYYGDYIHYTYTNGFVANSLVLISKFNKEPEDSDALGVFRAAFPEKTVVQIDSSEIIKRSGALHCIIQHVYDCAPSGVSTTTTTTATTIASTCVASGRSCAGPHRVCCDGLECPATKPQKCTAV